MMHNAGKECSHLNCFPKWPIWCRAIIKKCLSSAARQLRVVAVRLHKNMTLPIFVLMHMFMVSIKSHSKSQFYDNVLMLLHQIPKGLG